MEGIILSRGEGVEVNFKSWGVVEGSKVEENNYYHYKEEMC